MSAGADSARVHRGLRGSRTTPNRREIRTTTGAVRAPSRCPDGPCMNTINSRRTSSVVILVGASVTTLLSAVPRSMSNAQTQSKSLSDTNPKLSIDVLKACKSSFNVARRMSRQPFASAVGHSRTLPKSRMHVLPSPKRKLPGCTSVLKCRRFATVSTMYVKMTSLARERSASLA